VPAGAVASLSVLALLLATGSALAGTAGDAAKPKAGATYKGTINGDAGAPISFKVSADGSSVTDVRIPQPLQLSCLQGKAGPPETTTSSPAPISSPGETFTATVNYPSDPGLTATVTGQFLAQRAEQGQVVFTYALSPSTASEWDCSAPYTQTGTYATKAKKRHKKKKKHGGSGAAIQPKVGQWGRWGGDSGPVGGSFVVAGGAGGYRLTTFGDDQACLKSGTASGVFWINKKISVSRGGSFAYSGTAAANGGTPVQVKLHGRFSSETRASITFIVASRGCTKTSITVHPTPA
jgi:hypothetical protein